MIKGKKGSIIDLVVIGGIVFTVAIMLLIGYKMSSEVNTKIQANSLITADAKTISSNIVDNYPTVLDDSFVFFTIGLCLVSLAMATLVRIHPVFIIFYIITLVIVIIMAGVFSNAYETFALNPAFSTLASNMVMMSNIMTYLPLILGVFGTILMIIMYKGWKDEQ